MMKIPCRGGGTSIPCGRGGGGRLLEVASGLGSAIDGGGVNGCGTSLGGWGYPD